MNKTFVEMGLSEFHDKKQFLDLWSQHVDKLVESAESRHLRRLEFVTAFQLFNPSLSYSGEFKMTCDFTRDRITNAKDGVWLKGCTQYHLISIEQLYQDILSKKVNSFACSLCTNIVKDTKSICLNMICYQYFDLLEDTTYTKYLQIKKRDLTTEEIRNPKHKDNQVVLKAQRKVLTINLESNSKQFQQMLMSRQIMMEKFQLVKLNISDRVFDNLDENKQVKLTMICPFSKKRIVFPIIHRDCDHKEPVMFDLCELLLTWNLEQSKNTRVDCPLCQSYFIFDNITQVGLVDTKILECSRREPSCYIYLYFNRREHQLREQMRRRNISDAAKVPEIEKKLKLFFKNKDRNNYKKHLEQIVKEIDKTQQIQLNSRLSKDDIPVRCVKCNQLSVLDVWDYYNQFIVSKTEVKKQCLLCKQGVKASALSTFLYFDYGLWELTKLGISNILFNPGTLTYTPNISAISSSILVQLIGRQKRFIHSYSESTPNFQLKLQSRNIPQQLIRTIIPIVLKSCLNRPGFQVHEHIILMTEEDEIRYIGCKKCGTQIQSVDDIYIDKLLLDALKSGIIEIKYNKDDKKYKDRVRIRDFMIIDDLIREVKKQYTNEIQNELSFKIKKSDSCILYPAIVKNCKMSGNRSVMQGKKIFDLTHILDLEDVFRKENFIMCPLCKTDITYLDQLVYLPSIETAIEELTRRHTFDQLAEGYTTNRTSLRTVDLIPSRGQNMPASIYESAFFKMSERYPLIDKIIEQFKDIYMNLPENDEVIANIKLPAARTGGGIFVNNVRPIPRFNPIFS